MIRISPTIILLVAVLAAGGCTKKKHAEKTPAPIVKGATVETIAAAAMPETLEVTGTVRARVSALISARIPGTISVLRVREGDRVHKGQFLVRLESQENQASAAAAFSGIDEAKQALDEAISRKKLADTTFERYQNLYKEQAITRQEFDTKLTEKDLGAQGVARAEARLKQAQAGSRAASTMAGYSRIVAPISGVIVSKQADLGSTVFPAQPLMTIEGEGNYQLEMAVPESFASRIKAGMPVQVTIDSAGTPLEAKISEIVPAADPLSRTFIAKVPLDRTGLKSGMFGRATINLGTTANGMLVPRRAVMERGALVSVWVVEKNNTARLRLVKTGKTVGEKVEVLSGLSNGERVVVGGVEKISEGAQVE